MANQNEENSLQVLPKVPLGTPVTYVSTKGHQKAAFVVATPESIEAGTSLPELSEGFVHLAVFTWAVGTYAPRLSVPFEAIVAGNSEFQNEDSKAAGYWKFND